MDVSRPHSVISRSADADVLRVVTGTTDALTGRQVHRLVGGFTNKTVQAALDRFAAEGLLDVRKHGPSKLYTFNREHLAAPAVVELMSLRQRLVDRLRHDIDTWEPAPEYAALFGSAARGDGDTSSDIDILIVRPDAVDEDDSHWRQQVEQLADRVRRWTGNHAGVSELAASEIRALSTESPPIFDDLREAAIPLRGPRFEAYVRTFT